MEKTGRDSSLRSASRVQAQTMGLRSPVLFLPIAALLVLLLVAAAPLNAFPASIPLPDGFRPEGIAVGRGANFYVGSIPTGAIYAGDLRTGAGGILVPPQAGRNAIGLDVDRRSNALFVAGGPSGAGYVYDAETGAPLAAYPFAAQNTFVNDVVVTRNAAYFTDSFRPFLYRVPLGAGGALPDPSAVQEIALGGEYDLLPGSFNTNGIDATPNGKTLIIVHSTLGALYRVDPQSGYATQIDLNGGAVPNGDGILLDGKTLYVVQNRLNQIAEIELAPSLTSGEIVSLITDPAFRVPTTIAEFGRSLYAVNARFDTPPQPDTDYDVVKVTQ